MLILLILAFAVIGVIQVPRMIKKKKWHDVVLYSAFLAGAFVLHLLYYYNIKIPDPTEGFMELMNRLGLRY